MGPSLIQVQIATALSEDGVSDIRWVLLDPSDEGPSTTAAITADAVVPATSTPSGPSVRGPSRAPMTDVAGPEPVGRQAAWTYQLLRALVLAAALVAAWWVASGMLEQRPPASKASLASTQTRR